jgi:hypothetical protein
MGSLKGTEQKWERLRRSVERELIVSCNLPPWPRLTLDDQAAITTIAKQILVASATVLKLEPDQKGAEIKCSLSAAKAWIREHKTELPHG